MRRSTVGRGRQAGFTLDLLIAHLEKIAPPVLLREPSPPVGSMNDQLMLKELKWALCSNILSQPLELQCGALVWAKCLQEWIAATGAVNCPCCSEDGPLVSSHVRRAPGVILLLSEVLVHLDSSNWCCELSLLFGGWSLVFLPCQTSTRCDTPAIGGSGTLHRLQRDIKAGVYEGHDCVPSLTPEEEKQAAGLLEGHPLPVLTKASYNFLPSIYIK